MLIIRNAVHLGASVDLALEGGKIVTMTPAGHYEYPAGSDNFDGGGLTLMPSLIDCHVHLRDPGQTWKEDIASGLSAAAHGGFGNVMCMANTKPINDSAAVTRYIMDSAARSHPKGPFVRPIAAATIGLEGKEISPLAEMKEAGCVAVSNDGRPLASSEILRRVMEYASDLGLIFIDHCEDPDLAKGWIMNEGKVSGELGLKGQPGAGEAIQAMRDIMMAEYLKLPVYIAHVSSRQTVAAIAWGRERGVNVYAETCPHYLLLDESVMLGYNSLGKVSPPIRTLEDRDALRDALREGLIQVIATDHAPHSALEKDETLDKAPFGISGLDSALPLMHGLVVEGVFREADLHKWMAENPAKIFGLPYNSFTPGDPADFILFDPNASWRLDKASMRSKSANTPFINQMMKGKVMHQWLNGEKLF